MSDEFQLDLGHGQLVSNGMELDARVKVAAVDPEIDGFHILTGVVDDVDGFDVGIHTGPALPMISSKAA